MARGGPTGSTSPSGARIGSAIGSGIGALLGQVGVNRSYGSGIGGLQGLSLQGARTPFLGTGLSISNRGQATMSPERQRLYDALVARTGQGFDGEIFGGPSSDVMGQYNAQQGMLGANMNMAAPDLMQYGQPMQGLMGGFAQGAQDYSLDQLGMGYLGEDFSALRAQELQTMRDAAQPYEDRAQESFLSSLFSKGQLGTTGGARQTEGFMNSMNQADLQRQLAATQTAQRQFDLNTGRGLGAIGAGQAGRGMSYDMLAGGTGLMSGLAGQQFGLDSAASDMNLNRGQQRLTNSLGIFGLTNDQIAKNLGVGMGGFGALQGVDTNQANINQGLLSAGNQTYNLDINKQGMINNLLAQQAESSGGFLGGLGGALGGAVGGFMTGGWGGALSGAIKGYG